MKNLLNNETIMEVLRILIKQVLPFIVGVWFVIGLVAMLVTIKAWSDFATGDFIFGMLFVINVGFFFVIVYALHRIQTLTFEVRSFEKKAAELENKVTELGNKVSSMEDVSKQADAHPATDEPPSMPWEFYTDDMILAEVKAAEERELNLPPDDYYSCSYFEQPEK